MSWTEEVRLRRFYRRRLVPAAEALRQRNLELFPSGPEAEAETWYVAGPAGEPEFVELEPEQCEARLRELWEGRGLPELAELAGPILGLARRLEVKEEVSEDLSPFVYVMY